ncbi:putative cell morphogenesis protein Sog2 [Aspergillus saccharolyticus JOP 1030-1]|uniref:Cell morphogenesis protein Sog2 n=1 Tax=Aspergillus saccharolyticus JOP 1030-1 TaxID=1450539 RepID=A0A318ZIS9_9EURO|nr:cell morphogenesis protein Sog2 [Aspergillus saccharolyticus JOP 1030-1]PYH47476.1 cell morphogenesis protein Sog2 [Aspergillus saccharolyticus JOP 1030-1]
MLSTMVRPEDTIRMPFAYRGDADEDDHDRPSLEQSLPASLVPASLVPPSMVSSSKIDALAKSEDEVPSVNGATGDGNGTTGKHPAGPRLLTTEETIELARRAVENGIQETKRSLAGSEAVTDVVKPKLTIDLGHSNISRIPESVVDTIKDEVERLSLSNNQLVHIPYRFAECRHLRYLNIRANSFREFPKGIYKLPLLEILDISRNKISHLPEEIKKLSSLRVLSVMQNRLDDLPLGISDMNKLQILKVAGNPLRYPLRRLIESSETEFGPSSLTDNEKEVAVTAELKRFLKTKQPVAPLELERYDPSEVMLDTPKPLKRGMSSRFPVIPSTGDGASDPKSPSLGRPPPIPMKSHYRIASGHNPAFHGSILQRPGAKPFAGYNERNRSNSEGIIQASLAARNKRMGVIRKNTDLGTLDETRPYRNSHLRGLSYGSILRTRPSGALSNSNSSSPSSPRERRRLKDGFVNRMSSLPEQKAEKATAEPIIASAKCILFALFQIQSNVTSLINVIKREDARRNSLEIVFYNASTHVDRLNEAIENAEHAQSEEADVARLANEAVKRECETCIIAYTHVGTQLRNSIDKIVSNGESCYVRSLILMIFGSMVELRNACAHLGVPVRKSHKPPSKMPIPEIKESAGPDRFLGPTVTPTRGREQSFSTRRYRSDTTIHHPQIVMNGPFQAASQYQSAVSSPGFGPTSFSFAARSRSSSRSNHINTSIPSSLATPRSGESFSAIPSSVVPRINPMTGLDEIEEERIFEKIFCQLNSACSAALQGLPVAYSQLVRCLELAEQTRKSEGIVMLWKNLINRCQTCLDVSEGLGSKLSNMKVKEPGGGMRNSRDFWHTCKAFLQSFVDLVIDMKEVRNMKILPNDIVHMLRPIQRSSREAGRLIDASPWSFLADMNPGNPPANIYGPPLQAQHSQHQTSVSANTFHHGPSLSPSVHLPATPLSAALGPAAQATVPSTPASAYSDKFFEGDVFQRADSLLSMPSQAPFFARR